MYLDGLPDIDEGGAYDSCQPVESHHLLHQYCIHTLWNGVCACVCGMECVRVCVEWSVCVCVWNGRRIV